MTDSLNPHILLDRPARRVLARAVRGRPCPTGIDFSTWVRILLEGEAAVDVADMGRIMDLVEDPALIYRMKDASCAAAAEE